MDEVRSAGNARLLVFTRLQKTAKWGCISLGVCYPECVFGAADEATTYSLTDQKV